MSRYPRCFGTDDLKKELSGLPVDCSVPRRCPINLKESNVDAWLAPALQSADKLQALLSTARRRSTNME